METENEPDDRARTHNSERLSILEQALDALVNSHRVPTCDQDLFAQTREYFLIENNLYNYSPAPLKDTQTRAYLHLASEYTIILLKELKDKKSLPVDQKSFNEDFSIAFNHFYSLRHPPLEAGRQSFKS